YHGAGGGRAGCGGGGVRRREPELRRAGGGVEPSGASPCGTRGWSGGAGWRVRRARPVDGDRAAGGAEGGRGVCAAGPVVSGGTPLLHAAGCEGRGAADAVASGGAAAANRGAGGVPRA